MIEILNIPVSLDAMLPDSSELLSRQLAKATKLPKDVFSDCKITRKSVDARKKKNVHFVLSVAVEDSVLNALSSQDKIQFDRLQTRPYEPAKKLTPPDCSHISRRESFKRPVIVGAGPAGLFCALYLARAGLRPLIIERGGKIEERKAKVQAFFDGGKLDTECNVQFGEGGAGTFSDGKLTTGTKGIYNKSVLREFVDAGAPENILINAKPHIGTDLLADVIKNIRTEIEGCGGQFMFNTRLDDLVISDGKLSAIDVTFVETSERQRIEADICVLSIGHSARDTYEMLQQQNFSLKRKPFSAGVRIEHLQSDINRAQYGAAAKHPALENAEYKLSVRNNDGRGVYSFCMCPGGTVVAAASEEGHLCVNGMSLHARDGKNANSALLVEVKPEDFDGDDPLAGMHFQRTIEQAAYEHGHKCGQSEFCAPIQTVGDFLNNTSGNVSMKITPTYPRAVAWTDLHECLPQFMTSALEEALPALNSKFEGFADPEAVMTAVEARSSAPIWIERDHDTLQAINIKGVYPAGEGAGYAGGIMSAAVDGIKCAAAIILALE